MSAGWKVNAAEPTGGAEGAESGAGRKHSQTRRQGPAHTRIHHLISPFVQRIATARPSRTSLWTQIAPLIDRIVTTAYTQDARGEAAHREDSPAQVKPYATRPYPTLPCPTLLYATLLYPTRPYPTRPYPTLLYATLFCPTRPYPTRPRVDNRTPHSCATMARNASTPARRRKTRARVVIVLWFCFTCACCICCACCA